MAACPFIHAMHSQAARADPAQCATTGITFPGRSTTGPNRPESTTAESFV
jgi:hypothetical protein